MFCSDVSASAALCVEHSGRNDRRGKQTGRSEHKEMSAASKTLPAGKSCSRTKWEADLLTSQGRPTTQKKKQVQAFCGTTVVRDQTSKERFTEITSGRSRWQQGLVATCQDSSHEAEAEGGESQSGLAHEFV
jgi:hypothetical protein